MGLPRRIASTARRRISSYISTLAFALFVLLIAGGGDHGGCRAFTPSITSTCTTCRKTTAITTELYLFQSSVDRQQQTTTTNGDSNGILNGAKSSMVNTNNNKVHYGYANGNSSKKIPFVIERLGTRPNDQVFKGIAEMCISVFFNDGKLGRAIPPWKEVQLSYLRAIQMADLRRRRGRDTKTNAMFVAYKVEEASVNAAQSQPLILNLRNVHNLNSLTTAGADSDADYVRGEILGFCEVSMVPFGLVATTTTTTAAVSPTTTKWSPIDEFNSNSMFDNHNNKMDDDDDDDNNNGKRMIPRTTRRTANEERRPVLTNLSVKKNARTSGVGTKLLEACERTASIEWGKSEIVLEVEDDNVAARNWYRKRGYRVLFSDPSSKRYDVSGLFLKKVACTRQILRKALLFPTPQIVADEITRRTPSLFGSISVGGVLRRLRENVLQTTS